MYAVSKTLPELVDTLTTNVNKAQLWYKENGMKSNPDKFQAISFGDTPECDILVDYVLLQPSNTIKYPD